MKFRLLTNHCTTCLIGCMATLMLSIGTPSIAADAPARDHDITLEDYFTINVITGCKSSPDGKFTAYTEMRWEDTKGKRNTDLWVVEAATKSVQRLTFDKANEGSPQWSSDSRYIYYTANYQRGEEKDPPYNGKAQVWRIPRDGGEPLAITRLKDGVGAFELSRDGKSLYFTASEEHYDEEWKDLKKEHKDLEYGHGVVKFSQVWKLDLSSWRSEKLIDDKRVIKEFTVTKDEKRVAMITTPDDTLLSNEGWSRIDIFDVAAKKVATLPDKLWRADAPSPYGWLDGLSWSSDGQALAFTISFDGYPPDILITEWKKDEPQTRKFKRPANLTINGGSLQFRGDSRDLCFTAEERARSRVYSAMSVRDGSQGEIKTLTPGDVVVGPFSYSENGNTLSAVVSTLTHHEDIYTFDTKGNQTRITNVNPQVDTWKLPQIQLVTWKGANGDEVEGILELPPDAKPGNKLPMVVDLHGGPTAATMYRLQYWIYGRVLLPAKGYALLSPNYRGSTGYGDKFMTDLIGRENDIEVQDILTGVDAMVERGIADPDRLGVGGWSNGGYLTNCVITHTDRFKAASSGAGVLDMVIQWGTEDTPGHVINYMQALPWAKPEVYEHGSPLYKLDKVKTPTLIHVGGNDERVPAAHSRALYRGLKHYLGVPTELIVYPGEGHGLTKYENRKAKMAWDVAWFDKYIMQRTSEEKKPPEKSATH